MKIWSNTFIISLTDCEISDVKNNISLVLKFVDTQQLYLLMDIDHGYTPEEHKEFKW